MKKLIILLFLFVFCVFSFKSLKLNLKSESEEFLTNSALKERLIKVSLESSDENLEDIESIDNDIDDMMEEEDSDFELDEDEDEDDDEDDDEPEDGEIVTVVPKDEDDEDDIDLDELEGIDQSDERLMVDNLLKQQSINSFESTKTG